MDIAVNKRETNLEKESLSPSDEKVLYQEITDNANLYLVSNMLPKHAENDSYLYLISALMKRIKLENGDWRTEIDNRTKFEFEDLQMAVLNKLKENKKDTFIFSFCTMLENGIEIKCSTLRNRIKWAALASGAVGLVPVPGISAMIDIALITKEVKFYIEVLQFTENHIRSTARSFGVDFKDLNREVLIRNILIRDILNLSNEHLMFESLKNICITFLYTQVALISSEEYLKGILVPIPVIGPTLASIIGGVSSLSVTYASLYLILNKLEEALKNVIKYCERNRR